MAEAVPSDTTEAEFARRLAGNEKKGRDRALKKLKQFLNLRSARTDGGFTRVEMLSIWKGLFYCMWMSDKPLVQEDLAKRVSDLMIGLPNTKTVMLFFDVFLETMHREWRGIDRLRMDKFYLLVRCMLEKGFKFLQSQEWDVGVVDWMLAILKNGPICPTNSLMGMHYHMCDIYLEELAKVGKDSLSSEMVLKFLDPYCILITKAKNADLVRTATDEVFQQLVENSKPALDLIAAEEEGLVDIRSHTQMQELDSSPITQLNIDYKALAERLFELASKDGVLARNRKKAFKLVEKFRELAEGRLPLVDVPDAEYSSEDEVQALEEHLTSEIISESTKEMKQKQEDIKAKRKRRKRIRNIEDVTSEGDEFPESSESSAIDDTNAHDNEDENVPSENGDRQTVEFPPKKKKKKNTKVVEGHKSTATEPTAVKQSKKKKKKKASTSYESTHLEGRESKPGNEESDAIIAKADELHESTAAEPTVAKPSKKKKKKKTLTSSESTHSEGSESKPGNKKSIMGKVAEMHESTTSEPTTTKTKKKKKKKKTLTSTESTHSEGSESKSVNEKSDAIAPELHESTAAEPTVVKPSKKKKKKKSLTSSKSSYTEGSEHVTDARTVNPKDTKENDGCEEERESQPKKNKKKKKQATVIMGSALEEAESSSISNTEMDSTIMELTPKTKHNSKNEKFSEKARSEQIPSKKQENMPDIVQDVRQSEKHNKSKVDVIEDTTERFALLRQWLDTGRKPGQKENDSEDTETAEESAVPKKDEPEEKQKKRKKRKSAPEKVTSTTAKASENPEGLRESILSRSAEKPKKTKEIDFQKFATICKAKPQTINSTFVKFAAAKVNKTVENKHLMAVKRKNEEPIRAHSPKKVFFEMSKTQIQPFRKNDKAIACSPSPSNIAFDPRKTPDFGLLKRSKVVQKKRKSASDFF